MKQLDIKNDYANDDCLMSASYSKWFFARPNQCSQLQHQLKD